MRRLVPVVACLGLAGCGADLGMPPAATTNAADVHDVWRVFVYAGAAIGVLVYGLLVWVLVRYRRRRDDRTVPPQTRELPWLEITYTAIPFAIVVALFVVVWPVNQRIQQVSSQSDMTLEVEGFDWSWRFTFPAEAGNDGAPLTVVGTASDPPAIELPLGATVHVVVRSADVVHSFYVRDWLFKKDAVPGQVNEFDVELTAAGTLQGQCAEFCGLDHALMRFSIDVVEPDVYRDWVQSRSRSRADAGAADAGGAP